MEAHTFLDNFASIADAPGGVQRLRDLVLDLAIHGRLVEQRQEDGTAEDLLADIPVRRAAMVSASVIGKPRHPEGIPVDRPPYEVPASWAWVRLGDVSAVVGGGTPRSDEPSYWADGPDIPWITPADMRFQSSRFVRRGSRDITAKGLAESSAQLLPLGSVLFSSRAPIGHVGIAGQPLATNQGFKSCVPYLEAMSEYLYVFLRHVGPSVEAAATGTTFKEVSGKEVSLIPVPVPPLAEQERIVARANELAALCDELEAHRERRRRASTRFRSSVLHALADVEIAEDLRPIWDLASSNWPTLTDCRDGIPSLRRAILQLAVSGRLSAGATTPRGTGHATSVSASGASGEFTLPEGWAWKEFGELCEKVTVGHVGPMASRYVNAGVPFLRSQNVGWFRYDPTDIKYIDAEFHAELSKSALVGGEVVSVRSGIVGRTCVFPTDVGPANCADLVIMRVGSELDAHYAAIVMNSPYGVAHVLSKKVGIAQAHFNIGSAKRMPTPIPAISIQRELVLLVRRLLTQCDELEALLGRQDVVAERLATAAATSVLI